MSETEELESLLGRSAELHNALDAHLSSADVDESAHTQVTLATALISLEHATSVCDLVKMGQLISANALLRTQLEATVRTAWLLYAASDEWLGRYVESARRNPLKDPGASPTVEDTIRAIERRATDGKAPAGVAPQLLILKQSACGDHVIRSCIREFTVPLSESEESGNKEHDDDQPNDVDNAIHCDYCQWGTGLSMSMSRPGAVRSRYGSTPTRWQNLGASPTLSRRATCYRKSLQSPG